MYIPDNIDFADSENIRLYPPENIIVRALTCRSWMNEEDEEEDDEKA